MEGVRPPIFSSIVTAASTMGGATAKRRRQQQRLDHNHSVVNKKQKRLDNTPESDKKSKKPKHLHRKLAAAADDPVEKERLLATLHALEARKKQSVVRDGPSIQSKRSAEKKAVVKAKEEKPQTAVSMEEKAAPSTKTTKDTHSEPPAPPIHHEDHPQPEGDNSDNDEQPNKRVRGKRRRGRLDTSKQVIEQEDKPAPRIPTLPEPDQSPRKPRYCIGRKPITDFVVGQTYPATVVYAKPFGVFLDMNCHHDAFCHVSRCRDDYVKSATDVYQPGQKVDARVLEVDRIQKRITVSLQSEAMVEKERESIAARQKRSGKRKGNKPSAAGSVALKQPIEETAAPVKAPAPVAVPVPDESTMSPAELKRARKLARRAARREQQEQTDS